MARAIHNWPGKRCIDLENILKVESKELCDGLVGYSKVRERGDVSMDDTHQSSNTGDLWQARVEGVWLEGMKGRRIFSLKIYNYIVSLVSRGSITFMIKTKEWKSKQGKKKWKTPRSGLKIPVGRGIMITFEGNWSSGRMRSRGCGHRLGRPKISGWDLRLRWRKGMRWWEIYLASERKQNGSRKQRQRCTGEAGTCALKAQLPKAAPRSAHTLSGLPGAGRAAVQSNVLALDCPPSP